MSTDLPPNTLSISTDQEGETAFTVAVNPSDDIRTVGRIRAQKVAELIQAGATTDEAAAAVNATVRQLARDPDVTAACEKLIADFTFSASKRKELLRARMNAVLLNGDDRDAINAAKVIAADPEVSLGSQVPLVAQQFVTVTPELDKFLSSVEIPDNLA